MRDLRDVTGKVEPSFSDWLHSGAYLKAHESLPSYIARTDEFYWREPGLYLPLSCLYGVVNTTGVGGVNGGTTPGINTTGASLIILNTASAGAVTVSDSNLNTYTNLTAYSNTNSEISRLRYCSNPIVGSGHTFSVVGTSSFSTIAIIALSGAALSSPFDTENGNQITALVTTFQPGSITPSINDCIVVAGVLFYTGSLSINSGMSIDTTVAGVGGVNYGCSIAHIIQTTAGAINPTWTSTLSSAWSGGIASFKPAVAGSLTFVQLERSIRGLNRGLRTGMN